MPRAADERAALVACLERVVQALGEDAALPSDAARTWSEHQLLKHFGQRIRHSMEGGAQVQPVDGDLHVHLQSIQGVLRQQHGEGGGCTFYEPTADELAKWLPALGRLQPLGGDPRVRVVCFHSAGCAEDMFSSEGTGTRRAPSPLLEWCRAHGAELLAVQAPGRGSRQKEAACTSAQDLAQQALQALGHRLQLRRPTAGAAAAAEGHVKGGVASAAAAAPTVEGSCGTANGGDVVPWVIVSHSMGCWVAFELLRLARQKGLPMPAAWFVSAMPAPDIPEEERPWSQQRHLDEERFKAECRAWDINEVVFSPGMWQTYQPLLRADFTLFDEYIYRPVSAPSCAKAAAEGAAMVALAAVERQAGRGALPGQGGAGHEPEDSPHSDGQPAPFDFPIHAFWGSQDRRVTQAMVQEWRRFTTGPFSCTRIDGNHLWPLQKEAKAAWLSKVVEGLKVLFD